MPTPFKQCTCCGYTWNTRQAFLDDPTVSLVGYQPHFIKLTEGLFLFNHLLPDCLTTLAMPAALFSDLYDGPIFKERLAGTPQCAGHCLHADDLEPCPNKCECAYVRQVLQVVRTWPKLPASGAAGDTHEASTK